MYDDDDDDDLALFNGAADAVVELGNQLGLEHPDADPWALADGLLAGAVHFWMFAHQPQEHPDEDDLMSARERLAGLVRQAVQSAEESEYLHSPKDEDVGSA